MLPRFFGQTLEDFSDTCREVAAKWRDLLPKGTNRVRVRISGKDRVKPRKESDLGETLGEETTGLVLTDYDFHPLRYNQLAVLENVIAK